MKKAEIKFVRFINKFNRNIAVGQLISPEGAVLIDGSVAQILTFCQTEQYEITNAQEILDTLVRRGGFAA